METWMREPTLRTLGLGTPLSIFREGRLPADPKELKERVFGRNGSLVISGAGGIVGAGKAMQLGARLLAFGVPVVALDLPGALDRIGEKYPGLVSAFGRIHAGKIMDNMVRLTYDGVHLPRHLDRFEPRFLLEAIPEILGIKRDHYRVFREAFPGIEIRSVTSGFPSEKLGVGIAHPAFPHETNRVWEVVEDAPSDVTRLLWALGMVPVPVSDHWSFVLDLLFCGLTLGGLRYHRATSVPFWKIDRQIRKLLGPNPFRAHDVIGAKGANFLTWSCLHHLEAAYGGLFAPTAELVNRKGMDLNWYPRNHFRPVVDREIGEEGEEEFNQWILGAMIQATSLLLFENRSHLSHINAVGEMCAQFRRGMPAVIRSMGPDRAMELVRGYHGLCPEAAEGPWYPVLFETMEGAEWRQLYVNAGHDGEVGVITIGRESYNHDVDMELNRAVDWLKTRGVLRVILTGDFHLATGMAGADISEFFTALGDEEEGVRIAETWSKTARRLHDEFPVSVGFINGKRCLGGMLELMRHCRFLVSVEEADLGMPEVTLPVVPGMEGCHWPFRRVGQRERAKLINLLLSGKPVKAKDARGWLVDYAGSMPDALGKAWKIVTHGEHGLAEQEVKKEGLKEIPVEFDLSRDPSKEEVRRRIIEAVLMSCRTPLSEALLVQARHSAGFMAGTHCRKGTIGRAAGRIMGG